MTLTLPTLKPREFAVEIVFGLEDGVFEINFLSISSKQFFQCLLGKLITADGLLALWYVFQVRQIIVAKLNFPLILYTVHVFYIFNS